VFVGSITREETCASVNPVFIALQDVPPFIDLNKPL